jgi:hypothetical protein
MLDKENITFIRNTEAHENKFYPSATFHSIISISNCGYFSKTTILEDGRIKTPYFHLKTNKLLTALNILDSFEKNNKGNKNWFENLINISSHARSDNYESNSTPNLRTLIVLDLLLDALNCLFEGGHEANVAKKKSLLEVEVYVKSQLEILTAELSSKREAYSPGKTPAPIIHIISCFLSYNKLFNKDEFKVELDELEAHIDSHIDFHMARCMTSSVSLFDPVSLASALFSKLKIKPAFRKDPFFKTCLKTIVENQFENGCWPDGISLTFSSTGDVVQQPSVGVAVYIAECAIYESFLTDFDENTEEILKIVVPSLRKTAKFLTETFESNIYCRSELDLVSGWSSDRIRRKKYVEAWITSLSCRFFYRLWIAEMAMLRSQSLIKLGVKYFKSKSIHSSLDELKEQWDKEVTNPDINLDPTTRVWNNYVKPILERKDSFGVIKSPDASGVSFILFGPPGSGKTHFVNSICKILDWPLVELSPGHFIKNGLELIEATAKELFETLGNIYHAVVFFDECDELFRERNTDSAMRSILSFATASMLSKLQKLHDNKRILFVLGTNYVSNIDIAIRRPGRFDDIILLDRPDVEGRKSFYKKFVNNCTSNIDNVLKDTEYYTFSEMVQYIKNGQKLVNPSTEDYKAWCKTIGPKELDASRYTTNEINKIKERWPK